MESPARALSRKGSRQSGGGQDLDADDLGLSNEKSAVLSIQKVHTNDGEQMTVYWEDADPILIENRGGTLFPSVYLIWRQPRLLTSNRVFFIHSGVLESCAAALLNVAAVLEK